MVKKQESHNNESERSGLAGKAEYYSWASLRINTYDKRHPEVEFWK